MEHRVQLVLAFNNLWGEWHAFMSQQADGHGQHFESSKGVGFKEIIQHKTKLVNTPILLDGFGKGAIHGSGFGRRLVAFSEGDGFQCMHDIGWLDIAWTAGSTQVA